MPSGARLELGDEHILVCVAFPTLIVGLVGALDQLPTRPVDAFDRLDVVVVLFVHCCNLLLFFVALCLLMMFFFVRILRLPLDFEGPVVTVVKVEVVVVQSDAPLCDSKTVEGDILESV